ncbi:MAG TPA: M23 family metallopeptidase [Rhodospirillales bacterium]|jgi:murein DD-endopeptidase MepM/ murein hydrolase activator NlpD|nr:M23 family metallopeptidase [Rhodospirillales bacterium]
MNVIRAVPKTTFVLMVSTVLAASAGCGWVEWPPPGSRPRAVNRPSPPVGSSPLFVGAEAVYVGKGDTVYALSRRHRVAVRAIIEANRLGPPYHLRIGQLVVLPRTKRHAVERGDTLNGISRRYGVGLYVLARANGLATPYIIKVGKTLRIPGAGGQARIAQGGGQIRPRARDSKSTAPAPKPPIRVSEPPVRGGKGFLWPVKGKLVSRFGVKQKGLHNDGINIAAPRGTAVVAAENGIVAYAGNELRGFGNLLLVKHSGGWLTAYAHNERLLVKRGEQVRKGQRIANVGSTGTVSTPQLHFELRKGQRAVNPRKHLRRARA